MNNPEIVDLVEDDHFIIEESNVYSSPKILEGIYKNIIPLYSLIMSKCNSLIELVAKDDQRKFEFKIKTTQYPSLPILHANSFISYSPMKFQKLSSGYNTPFTKKRVSDDVKFSAIKTHIYSVLLIEELTSIKFNEKYNLEVKDSTFLAVCSNCWCDINSEDNLSTCSTTDCTFKLCSKKSCHHYIDNNNYCENCKIASIMVLDKENIASEEQNLDCEEERIFEDEFNEDCVTVFFNQSRG